MGEPAVPQSRCPLERTPALPAYPDRRVGPLYRLRLKDHAGDVTVCAMKLGIVRSPQLPEDPNILVRHSPALLEWGHVQYLELLPHPPDAATHGEPAAGEHVNRRQHLGSVNRASVRHHEHAGHEADTARGGGHEAQQRRLVQEGGSAAEFAVVAVRVPRPDLPRHYQMVPGAQKAEPQLLTPARQGRERAARSQRPANRNRKPKVHSVTPAPIRAPDPCVLAPLRGC